MLTFNAPAENTGLSPDLQPIAQRIYSPGLNAAGRVLSLDVRKEVWDHLGATDQAIFEVCAAEAYQLALAEARAHEMLAAQVAATSKWPVRSALGRELSADLERTAGEVLADLTVRDRETRRIHDSYLAFRAMLGDALVV